MPAPPADYALRPATQNDIHAVNALIAQQNTADFGEPLLLLDDLRKQWQAADFSLSTYTRVAVSKENQLLGYAEIRPYSPNKFSSHLYLDQKDVPTRIGKDLLSSLENNLAANDELIAKVSGTNQRSQQSFESLGYARGLTFLMMELIMKAPPPTAKWTEGVVVRPFTRNQDESATYATDEEASKDKGYSNPLSFADWAQRMSLDNNHFDPTLWFLACREDEVVGVSLNFYLAERDYGLIDHLGVRRKWRGQGIGLALLQHSFAAFHARGIKKVRLNVDSGSLTNAPRLYEKAGMKTVQTYHIYSKTIT